MPTLNQLPIQKVKPFLKFKQYELRTIKEANHIVEFNIYNTKTKNEIKIPVKNLDIESAFKKLEKEITKLKL